ncbi:MAG: HNH endonuclease signature motif containing protein [Rhodothermales bacterium]
MALLTDFEQLLERENIREQVCALIPAVHLMRDLGASLPRVDSFGGARDRILNYLQRFPATAIAGDEIGVVSGISEYARRVRELRVEMGWPIFSGTTAKEMIQQEHYAGNGQHELDKGLLETIEAMVVDDYILLGDQDRDAAHRWNLANSVRKQKTSVRDRLLSYLRQNVGIPVTGEELRYVAKGATEWARRTRELRTELGWPVSTRNSGRPDLPVGIYVLEADRQLPEHDRVISDPIRVTVLERDKFSCQRCGWNPGNMMPGDPRTLLELHHIEHHVDGGENVADNLITLCNVHHDELHRLGINGNAALSEWLASD